LGGLYTRAIRKEGFAVVTLGLINISQMMVKKLAEGYRTTDLGEESEVERRKIEAKNLYGRTPTTS